MTSTKQKVFAPSRSIVDEATGKKYRLCAAAAVWNSQNELLVGERITIANAWQAPQGGVDAAWEENNHQDETIVQSACRELYEEMGLVVGKHVVVVTNDDEDALLKSGIRYETNGTSNWLTRAGFAGQQLHWVHFRCMDGRGDANPNIMCDLSGQNGESAEFTKVAWKPLPQVIEEMWPAKRAPYEALQEQFASKLQRPWLEQYQTCAGTFAGVWSRDNALCSNVVNGLVARGMSKDQAEAAASQPYVQKWTFNDDTSDWTVINYKEDGVTTRRTLLYPWGEWEETYQGESTLFGKSDTSATLKRRTFYAPEGTEDDAKDDTVAVAHVTVSQTPKGDTEESRRYRKGEHFILKRTFWPKDDPDNGVVSTEVFTRQS